ncbi:MAG: hypothetical protein A2146_05000 [Actinobacteria bacterium RBG_16_67_10]|nr:MAG: hypothetical protein A2146_05000 [Actinobacteria bacterium RBG_16_67_10]
MPDQTSLGFIGTGNMGYHMAANLLKAGYPLTVYDLRREAAESLLRAGAKWADGVDAVARASAIVLASLPRPASVEAVALGPRGVLANLRRGGVFVDLTTNAPATARKVAAEGRKVGVDVLDSPVSGGVYGAQSRRLTLMVGGEPAVLERCRPVLEVISDNVVYCGPSGAGAVTKIVNNVISLGVTGLVGEALMLGVKAGVDLKGLTDIIKKSSGGTWRMEHSFPKFLLKGNFAPGFAIDLALKDLQLGSELARECGLSLDYLPLSEQKYVEAQKRGWGQLHSEAIVKLLEEQAGVELRIPGA